MKRFLLLLIAAPLFSLNAANKKPRLTVILVIDQGAYHYLPKLSAYFKNGINFLMQNGIFYQKAYFPHAIPSTGPGHTALATGITADYHGIISNYWCDGNGKRVACDDDTVEQAAVFNPTGGMYEYGKGPGHIMVDSITDQFVLSDQPGTSRISYSVSIKSRAAICTANKLGKAIWFDTPTGLFTSSKAYFKELPAWLVQFNKSHETNRLTKIAWPLFYPAHSPAYSFKNITNYHYSARPRLAGKNIPVNQRCDGFGLFEHTPAANQILLELATHCIKTHMSPQSTTEMMVWVCLSPLDLIGHDFGPQSLEAIDMLYHLDLQIKQFMETITAYLKRSNVLFVLTADHGVSPIPELLNQEGYAAACRIDYAAILKDLNEQARALFNIDNLMCSCLSGNFYFRKDPLATLSTEQQEELLLHMQKRIASYPGIKRVWTQKELTASWYPYDDINSFYKRQTFPGRSGQLIVQPYPYCLADDFMHGTGHRTPYEPDTHVPLIIYQAHHLERRTVHEKVWTLQLANSLAHILECPCPCASTYSVLPGLGDYSHILPEIGEPALR